MKLLKMKTWMALTIFLGLQVGIATGQELGDYLSKGNFDEGIEDFSVRVEGGSPKSNERLFSLGVLHFFDGLENLAQGFYRFGLNSKWAQSLNIPFLRLPVEVNPRAEKLKPSDIYEIMDRFNRDMSLVNKTLSKASDGEFRVPIDISTIRIDINQNGAFEDREYFHKIYSFYNRRSTRLFDGGKKLIIEFDQGDLYWLKGYSHLLMAMTDTLLAYDWGKVYKHTAHVFFPFPQTKIKSKLRNEQRFPEPWIDLIAGVHAMRLPVEKPERLIKAHKNLLETVKCSRITWKIIQAETDNDREWIPNPRQVSVTGARIDQELIDGWHQFLDEFEKILKGEKLIPHWRLKQDLGVNLKKYFYKPKTFDFISWIQGEGAIPYLEKGNLTSREEWNRITDIFRGNFIGFATWVN